MAFAVRQTSNMTIHERALVPGLVLMLCALGVAFLFIVLNSDLVESFPYLYLLPWIMGLGLVLIAPTAYLYQKGRLKLYDPLVFATWAYLFPSFVVGGLMLAGGWSKPPFMAFIQDAPYNLPYAVVLVMVGFVGLAVGYFLPIGANLGAAAGRFLPAKDFDSSALLIPGVSLLVLGTINTVFALIFGIIGYQKVDEIDPFSGTVYLTTLFWMQGSFILWYVIFRRGRFDLKSAALGGLMFALTIGRALFAGNRAALMQVILLVILAFFLAGGKMNARRAIVAGIVFSVALIAGVIYGTTFRNIKGGEDRVSIGQYSENVFDTFEEVGKFDISENLQFAFMTLAERMDILSSVAVVVSNYEALAPYEESYGLDNNIWKDLTTFFVPRMLWNDKPLASEPRKYSELYFDFGESSFAITPMGDLLRNFGPIGIPIGMLLFGIVLRFLYRALVEDQPQTMWRRTLYFMLLISISYEGFYGALIPTIFKVGITAIAGLLFVSLVARAVGHRRVEHPA